MEDIGTASIPSTHRKILFQLDQDEDGYPPVKWESLWARKMEENQYQIDSIPFFVRGISLRDVINAENKDDEWHFKHVISYSNNSVMRVIVFNPEDVADIRKELQKLGCATELSHLAGLFAVDIPPNVKINLVDDLLRVGKEMGKWECEDASIRA